MSRRKMKTGDLNPSEKAQLFSSEILEIYAAVSDNSYDSRSEVGVSKELQSYLLSQNIGQVARSFTGPYKTNNVHDSVVSLLEQLHEFEAKQYRQMNDDEIVNGFWNMTEGKMPQKPRMTDREWDAHQELRATRALRNLPQKPHQVALLPVNQSAAKHRWINPFRASLLIIIRHHAECISASIAERAPGEMDPEINSE